MTANNAFTSARKLLSELESDMNAPNAAGKLSEALSLLSDIAGGGTPEGQTAENVVAVYTAKAVAAVDAALAKPGEISADELCRWKDLLSEFGRWGFESPLILAALSRLSKRSAARYVSRMTRTEREVLLRKLEEDSKKRGS